MIKEFLSSVTEHYKIKLPVSNKVITIRPYTVAEEKLILMLQDQSEEEKTDTYLRLVNNCVIDDIEVSNLYDVVFILIELRKKSKDNIINLTLPCENCNKTIENKFNIDDIIKINNTDIKQDSLLKLTDNVGLNLIPLQFKYCNLLDVNNHASNQIYKHIDSMVNESSNTKLNIKEKEELINNLPIKLYNKILEYYAKGINIGIECEMVCQHCKSKFPISEYNNILSFLV